jgi:hypothetical protein
MHGPLNTYRMQANAALHLEITPIARTYAGGLTRLPAEIERDDRMTPNPKPDT